MSNDKQDWTSPLEDFQEGQWWVHELDCMVARQSTPDQARAVAVVHHLLRAVKRDVDGRQRRSEQPQLTRLLFCINGQTAAFATETKATDLPFSLVANAALIIDNASCTVHKDRYGLLMPHMLRIYTVQEIVTVVEQMSTGR